MLPDSQRPPNHRPGKHTKEQSGNGSISVDRMFFKQIIRAQKTSRHQSQPHPISLKIIFNHPEASHLNDRSQVNWKLTGGSTGNAGVLAGSLKPGEADGDVGVPRGDQPPNMDFAPLIADSFFLRNPLTYVPGLGIK